MSDTVTVFEDKELAEKLKAALEAKKTEEASAEQTPEVAEEAPRQAL